MSATSPLRDRFVGCLIGQCLGDALGFPVEGYPPEDCRAYVDTHLRLGTAALRGRGPFRFGQYTDDSQLAREMLQSFVGRGAFDPADYAGRIAAIFVDKRIVGRGRTTEAAAMRLARGVSWDKAGTPAPHAGNGSAMRAGAAGLIAARSDTRELARIAHDQGRITHADPRCSAGAVAIAGAVWLAINEPSLDRDGWIDRLSGWTAPFDRALAGGIDRLADWVTLDPADAVERIAKVGLQPGFSDVWAGISPYVTTSVLWSLYAFLRTPDDYWATVCTAIEVGGDVDTTAAMAGAVSGAYNGIDAIPSAHAMHLNDRQAWTYHALCELAQQAHALATRHRAG